MKTKKTIIARLVKGQLITLVLIFSMMNLAFGQIINGPVRVDEPLIQSPKDSKINYVPGEVLVRFKSEFDAASKEDSMSELNTEDGEIQIEVQNFEGAEIVQGLRLVKVGANQTFDAIEALNKRDDVIYAEPNYIYYENVIPNDTSFFRKWDLLNTGQVYGGSVSGTPDADIDADDAWNITTGDRNIVIGIVDSGLDVNHPDLQANVWTNPDETPGNGIDDDGNGYIDDMNGWDFLNNDASVYDDPDDDDHGTHVAGIAGATGNNSTGVTGVNWEVSLMSLKTIGTGGSTTKIAAALNYARDMRQKWINTNGAQGANVRVLNNSYGGSGFSQTMFTAISQLNSVGILFVASAGNESTNTDYLPHYPSDYDLPNVISVAATDDDDNLAGFSNFGVGATTMGAPGRFVYSTIPDNKYAFFSGTSMASPQVAGAAALILAQHPNLTVKQLKSTLIYKGDPKPALANGVTTTGRRLNVNNSFQNATEVDNTPPNPINNLSVVSTNGREITLQWTSPSDNGSNGKAALYEFIFASLTGPTFPLTSKIPSNAGVTENITVKLPYKHPSGTITLRTTDFGDNSRNTTVAVSVPVSAVTPYNQTFGSVEPLTSGGTGLNLKDDDFYEENYSLPFAFPFYENSYNSVTISTNGVIYFTPPPKRSNGDADDASNNTDTLLLETSIAGLWEDIRTDRNPTDDVYVITPDANTIIFKWQGVTYDDEVPINFEVELKSNGSIKFRYGAGNTSLTPTVGMSGGEPDTDIVTSYSSNSTDINLTNRQEVIFTPAGGGSPTPTPTPTPGNYAVSATPNSVTPGGSITVNWTAPSNHSTTDWIGIYKVGEANNRFLSYEYVGSGSSGSMTFTAPNELGQYEFRYLLNNGYTSSATSNTVTVSPQ